ncbi:MAG: glycosyltransferase family 2 protein [Elusimicrobiota bacterium]|jgi:glycosyltransferase involved in cell wall biosynthesis|nr:glycosyltransferase family 2 protein [Elusimicrobiota bacterium]
MDISIVIPFYNEEESLKELYQEIKRECLNNRYDYEIIFVNDGSYDKSAIIVKELIKKDSNIHLISLRKNFGKALALQIAFKRSKGQIIITMDADLQDDPSQIHDFVAKIQEGYDLVSGWKYNRLDPLEKRLPSKLFNKTISLLSKVKIHDFNCGFKAYRKEAAQAIDIYGEMHRYIPVLASRFGFAITEIPVRHRKRKFGKSKYGFERYFRGLFDCMSIVFVTKYIERPMYLFGRIALFVLGIGFIICSYLTILWFSGYSIAGRPLLMLGILSLILGAQFFSIGLIADILVKTTFRSNYNENYIKEIFTMTDENV